MSVRSIPINREQSPSASVTSLGQLLHQAWRFNRTITLGSLLTVALIPAVLLALWLAARVDWRQALAGLAWWLRGKRVRGRNLILSAASRDVDYYRYWIRAVEPARTLAHARTVETGLEIHFVLLAADHAGSDSIAASSQSIARAARLAKDQGIRAFEWTHAGGESHLSDWPTSAIDGESTVWLVPVVAGDAIAPATATKVAAFLGTEPTTRIVFWDEDRLAGEARKDPWVKGAFDDLLFLGRDGLTGTCAILATQLQNLVATYGDRPADASGLFELLTAATLEGGLGSVRHIPAILTHRRAAPVPAGTRARTIDALLVVKGLGRARISASVPDLVEIRPSLPNPAPSVTVIIPTRNRADLLWACFDGLKQLRYPGQIDFTVVDNGSDEPESLAYLDQLAGQGVKVLRVAGPFNFSRLNNIAVAQVDTDFVCLMNNDVKPLDGDWLTAMAGHAAMSGTGAVGALLLYPDRTVQHAGVEIGVGKGAGHAHRLVPVAEPGHAWLHRCTRHTSAVTAACLLVSRADYLAVGGLDENVFAVAFNDVDFCLKLQAYGRRNVFAAEAMLIHHESVSRQSDYLPQNIARFLAEFEALKSKWKSDTAIDPYRSPLLADQSEKHVLAY